jgi:ribosomal protein S6
MNTTNFTITRTTVHSDGYRYPTYKIQGWVNGRRIRKNFKSEQEAIGEKHRLEVFSANAIDPIRPAVTRLTPAQIADAETAFARIGDRPLSTAIDWFLTTYTAPLAEKLLADAVTAFLADRTKHVRKMVLRDYKSTLEAFKTTFPGKFVHEITTDRVMEFLDAREVGNKRRNNLRGDLHAFFNFCRILPRRWTKDNPVEPVPTFKVRRGLPEIITVEQCEKLMEFVESYRGIGDKQKPGCLVPYFALALFAGIRPNSADGEIVRLCRPGVWERLIDMRLGVIRITPEISKTKDMRQVSIRPNLRAWLEKYPLSEYPLNFQNFIRATTEVRQKFAIGHDVLRHTFISMHVGKYRSLSEAALEAGNSEEMTKKHYLNMVHIDDAERFWGIVPLVAN